MEPSGSFTSPSGSLEKKKPFAFGLRGSPLPARTTAVDRRGGTTVSTEESSEAAPAPAEPAPAPQPAEPPAPAEPTDVDEQLAALERSLLRARSRCTLAEGGDGVLASPQREPSPPAQLLSPVIRADVLPPDSPHTPPRSFSAWVSSATGGSGAAQIAGRGSNNPWVDDTPAGPGQEILERLVAAASKYDTWAESEAEGTGGAGSEVSSPAGSPPPLTAAGSTEATPCRSPLPAEAASGNGMSNKVDSESAPAAASAPAPLTSGIDASTQTEGGETTQLPAAPPPPPAPAAQAELLTVVEQLEAMRLFNVRLSKLLDEETSKGKKLAAAVQQQADLVAVLEGRLLEAERVRMADLEALRQEAETKIGDWIAYYQGLLAAATAGEAGSAPPSPGGGAAESSGSEDDDEGEEERRPAEPQGATPAEAGVEQPPPAATEAVDTKAPPELHVPGSSSDTASAAGAAAEAAIPAVVFPSPPPSPLGTGATDATEEAFPATDADGTAALILSYQRRIKELEERLRGVYGTPSAAGPPSSSAGPSPSAEAAAAASQTRFSQQLGEAADAASEQKPADAVAAPAADEPAATSPAGDASAPPPSLGLVEAAVREAVQATKASVAAEAARERDEAVRAAVSEAAAVFAQQLDCTVAALQARSAADLEAQIEARVSSARREYEGIMKAWEADIETWRQETVQTCERALAAARTQISTAMAQVGRLQRELTTKEALVRALRRKLGAAAVDKAKQSGSAAAGDDEGASATEEDEEDGEGEHGSGDGSSAQSSGASSPSSTQGVPASDDKPAPATPPLGPAGFRKAPQAAGPVSPRPAPATPPLPPQAAPSQQVSPPVQPSSDGGSPGSNEARLRRNEEAARAFVAAAMNGGSSGGSASSSAQPPQGAPRAATPPLPDDLPPADAWKATLKSTPQPRPAAVPAPAPAPAAAPAPALGGTRRAAVEAFFQRTAAAKAGGTSAPAPTGHANAAPAAEASQLPGRHRLQTNPASPPSPFPGVPRRLFDAIMTMPVSALRNMLQRADINCDDCLEKSDLQRRLLEAVALSEALGKGLGVGGSSSPAPAPAPAPAPKPAPAPAAAPKQSAAASPPDNRAGRWSFIAQPGAATSRPLFFTEPAPGGGTTTTGTEAVGAAPKPPTVETASPRVPAASPGRGVSVDPSFTFFAPAPATAAAPAGPRDAMGGSPMRGEARSPYRMRVPSATSGMPSFTAPPAPAVPAAAAAPAATSAASADGKGGKWSRLFKASPGSARDLKPETSAAAAASGATATPPATAAAAGAGASFPAGMPPPPPPPPPPRVPRGSGSAKAAPAPAPTPPPDAAPTGTSSVSASPAASQPASRGGSTGPPPTGRPRSATNASEDSGISSTAPATLKERQDARLAEVAARDAAARAEADEMGRVERDVEARVAAWARGKGVKEMLITLPSIMPEGVCGPRGLPTDIADSASTGRPEGIKKAYLKAVKFVHPDKLGPEASPAARVTARMVFAKLSEAYKAATEGGGSNVSSAGAGYGFAAGAATGGAGAASSASRPASAAYTYGNSGTSSGGFSQAYAYAFGGAPQQPSGFSGTSWFTGAYGSTAGGGEGGGGGPFASGPRTYAAGVGPGGAGASPFRHSWSGTGSSFYSPFSRAGTTTAAAPGGAAPAAPAAGSAPKPTGGAPSPNPYNY